jgi:predicted nucleic acid-binding protein
LIYLDTSAFIKLFLHEEGSEEVQRLVTAQQNPLPTWNLLELEFFNALRFKVFLGEMTIEETERLISLYIGRKKTGLYYVPLLDPVSLHEMSAQMTRHTPILGCRSLDILHVAAARLIEAESFITADKRQGTLAEGEGLSVTAV